MPKDWRHILAILASDITILTCLECFLVRSFRLPLCCPCIVAESTPNNICVKQYCVSMHKISTAHRFGDEVCRSFLKLQSSVTIAFINTTIILHLGAVFASSIENMNILDPSSNDERQASRPRLAAMLVASY